MVNDTIYTFSFGHHIFNMPSIWLNYYPWLQKMFGISTPCSTKQELDTNLIHYLHHVPPYKIRLMIRAFEYEINTFYEIKQLQRRNKSRHLYYLNLMESFLKNGPGCTCGLDILYKCKTCGEETYEIKRNVNVNKVIPHKFQRLSTHSLVCTNCGHIWNSVAGNSPNQIFCTQIKASGCDHIWETCN